MCWHVSCKKNHSALLSHLYAHGAL
jgi:hypothetical protein